MFSFKSLKKKHFFFDQNNDPVSGAILDPKSREGQDFVNAVISEDPNIAFYMANATRGGDYDFKVRGINKKPKGQSELQYKYRGSLDENGEFGSARDFGNFTAGMIAARSGFTWAESRAAFDMLQTLQEPTIIPILGKPVPSIVPTREPLTTIKAQLHGFLYGIQRFQRKK